MGNKSHSVVVDYRNSLDNYGNGILESHFDYGGVFNTSSFVSYGSSIPNFRYLIFMGLSATSTADGRFVSASYEPGFRYHKWSQFGTIKEEHHYGIFTAIDPSVTYPYSSNLYNATLSRFVSKSRAVQHKFQAGVFLGELSETIHLLRSPLKIFRKLTREYHRKAKRLSSGNLRAKSKSKVLSDAYLTYVFGVLPLIADIDDAMYDLAALSNSRPKTVPVKAFSQDSYVALDSSSTSNYFSYWTVRTDQRHYVTQKVTIRGAVRVLTPNIYWGGSSSVKIALSDFLPTLWELIPYSFLIDYFTNIGNIVSALTFLESSVTWCNYTKRKEMKFVVTDTVTGTSGYPGPGAFVTISLTFTPVTKTSVAVTEFSRAPISSFIPSLSFTLPGFGSRRWLNMGALLSQCRSI